MKRQLLKIDHLKKIQNGIFAMTLTGDCSEISAPGQFINIKPVSYTHLTLPTIA